MYALIDCNSFYANCEKLFRPDLSDKPVVVLSNNDGCVVARSAEAKALGIKMAVPYFKVKDFCQANGVHVFSSNYALYADMSQRVMATLESLCPNVEIYSIDEAFLYLADYPIAMQDLHAYGRKVKEIVEKHTGIPIGVGIGETKTLAKLANHAAKKYPKTQGVCVLNQPAWIDRLMQITDVSEIWGVGRRCSQRLHAMGINTVYQFAHCEPAKIRQHFSVVLERTCLELNGRPCLELDQITTKKQIISSRSFSKRITNKADLAEAICGHVAKAATKLRAQKSACKMMTVFIKNSAFSETEKYQPLSGQFQFTLPTADTREMIAAAKVVLDKIYKPNIYYAKAGVMLSDIYQHDEIQQDLFTDNQVSSKTEQLMALIDTLNQGSRSAVFFASEGIEAKQHWQMNRNMLSPCYTTRVSDVVVVH